MQQGSGWVLNQGNSLPFGMETEYVEFKRSTAELNAATDSIAAILNKHQGGVLYFGVGPDGRVLGQAVTEDTLRKVSQAIAQRIEPAVFPDVDKISIGGKECVRVSFAGQSTPYASGGLYRLRVADEDRRMSTEQLAAFFRDRHFSESPWDSCLSSKTLAEVDEKALIRYVERGRAAGRISFEYENKQTALERLGLARGGRLTNAAAVLFCSSEWFMLKCGIFATPLRTTVIDMRQESGSLYDLLEYATMYVAKNIKWRFEFDGSPRRIEVPEVPMEAVREVLINAFCHRDYVSSLAIQVDIFSERIDVFSPGCFPEAVSPEDCLSGKVAFSESRNKLLAQALYRAKDIESYGTGMPRIQEACDAAGIKVEYANHRQGVIVSFSRPDWSSFKSDDGIKDKAGGECDGRLNGRIDDRLNDLKKSEQTVYGVLCDRGSMPALDLVAETGLSERTVRRALSRLQEKGFLRRSGSRKTGRWEVL